MPNSEKIQNLNLVIEIRYKKGANVALFDGRLVSIFELITGEKPKKLPKLPLDELKIGNSNLKTVVVLAENRIAIGVEKDDVADSKRRLSEVLVGIYDKFDFKNKEIERIGVRTQWIKGWDSSYTKLLAKYREVFFKSNPLVDSSSDVALPLTFEDEGHRVNFNSGPMKPEQGKLFVSFKDRDFPHDFIFVDVDRALSGVKISNEISIIEEEIKYSIEYGQEKAKQVIDLLA